MKVLLADVKDEMCNFLDYCLEELVHVTSNSEETYPQEKCPLWGMIPSVGTFASGSGLCHVHHPNAGNPAGIIRIGHVWMSLELMTSVLAVSWSKIR